MAIDVSSKVLAHLITHEANACAEALSKVVCHGETIFIVALLKRNASGDMAHTVISNGDDRKAIASVLRKLADEAEEIGGVAVPAPKAPLS